MKKNEFLPLVQEQLTKYLLEGNTKEDLVLTLLESMTRKQLEELWREYLTQLKEDGA